VTVIADVLKTKVVDAPGRHRHRGQADRDRSVHGQVPKTRVHARAEVTQSGLYDFNFNTRGFHSSSTGGVDLHRRARRRRPAAGSPGVGGDRRRARRRGQAGPSAGRARPLRRQRVERCREHHDEGAARRPRRLPRHRGELDTAAWTCAWRSSWATVGAPRWQNQQPGDFTVSRNPNEQPYPEYSKYCLLVDSSTPPGQKRSSSTSKTRSASWACASTSTYTMIRC
jgi:hypothetical protein